MRIITFIAAIVFTTLLVPSIARSQVRQDWQQNFATPPGYLFAISGWTITDGSGNVIVAAVFYPNEFAQNSDLAVYKYTASGSLSWSQVFESGGVASSTAGVATDAAGNIYVLFRNTAGTSNTPNGAQLMKYTPGGTLAWSQAMPYNATIAVNAMTADAAGNVYITGSNNYDYITLKYNTAGTLQWTSTYNGTASGNDIANAIAIDASGNVYVTGNSPGQETIRLVGLGGRGGSTLTLNTGSDIATVKYDPSGNTLWTARYNGTLTGNDYASSIAFDPSSGNIYVGGQTYTSSTVSVGDVLAYSSSGTQLWAYQDNQAIYTSGVAVDPSGYVITSESSASGLAFLVRKMSSSGSIIWTFPYGPNAQPDVAGGSLTTLDKQGNVYLASYVQMPTGSWELATQQVTSAGSQGWQVFNTNPYGVTGLTVFTPVSRFGQIVYPQVDVSWITTNNQAINTVQYQQIMVNELSSASDTLTGVAATLTPATAAQLSNYPNPFRGATTITYTLSQNSHVTLQVYDGAGRPMALLVDEDETAGPHTLPFNAGRLAAGIYQYRIIAQSPQGSFTQTKQMVIQ